MLKPKILSSLLHAASALGAVLGLGWLMREGGGKDVLLAVLFFLAVLSVLLVRRHPQAVGDGLDSMFCWLATKTRALAHYHQSGRIAYRGEAADPMLPLKDQVRLMTERLEELGREPS